jgi:hypothetical protein
MANRLPLVVASGILRQIESTDVLVVNAGGFGIDVASAGVLTLGAAAATGLTLGKYGVVTTVVGGLYSGDVITSAGNYAFTAAADRQLYVLQSANDTVGRNRLVAAGAAGGSTTAARGGGDLNLTSGNGGNAGTGNAGQAGYARLTGGTGGAGSASAPGQYGGAVIVGGGPGGAGTASWGAGEGASVVIVGGGAGAANGGVGASGGNVGIEGGAATGTGLMGSLLIGDTDGIRSMDVGGAGNNPTVNFYGTGQKRIEGNLDITGGLDVTGAAITVTLGVRMTEQAAPTAAANTGWAYTKDDGGDTELYYMDDGGAEVQITRDGGLAAADSLQNVATSVTTTALANGEMGYVSAANTLAKAIATSLAASVVFGCAETAADNKPTTAGICEAAQIQAGITVTFGQRLFLSPTQAGAVTSVAPTTTGQIVAELGIAMANGTGAGGTVKMLLRPLTLIEL